MTPRVDLLKGPEHHQHRHKSVCATLTLPIPVWHRHSCLCFSKMQRLMLLTSAAARDFFTPFGQSVHRYYPAVIMPSLTYV